MMLLNSPLAWGPDLDDAIERNPLIVPPTTPLINAITLISQAHGYKCSLADALTLSDRPVREVRASCVLVMQGLKLLGILTERDIVRLTAQALNFAEITVADVMVHPVITLPQESVQDIFAALFLFRRYRIRHLPIVDEQEHLVGVISHESIRQILRPANLLQFRRVSDVMAPEVVQAPLTATVLQLAQLMAKHRVSCIVITQWDARGVNQPVGIVTERDIVQFQALQINLYKTQAHTVMSTPLFLLSPEDSLWKAHQEMQKRRVGRLVVSWNWGQGLSIITQTNLLRVFDPMEMYGVIENLQQTIQQLERERSPTQSVPPLPPSIPPPPSPSDSFCPSISPPLPQNDVSERDHLLDLLGHVHKQLKHLMTDQDLAIAQQQSKFQMVLNTLEQIQHKVRSYGGASPKTITAHWLG